MATQPMPRAIPGIDAFRAQAQAGQLPARTGGFGPPQPMPIGPLNRNSGAPVHSGVPIPSQPMPIGPLNRNSGAPVPSGVPIPAKMKKGGIVKSSASSRGDGCATKGHTKGAMR